MKDRYTESVSFLVQFDRVCAVRKIRNDVGVCLIQGVKKRRDVGKFRDEEVDEKMRLVKVKT